MRHLRFLAIPAITVLTLVMPTLGSSGDARGPSPAGKAPPASAGNEPLVRLVTELALRLPAPWYVDEVKRGLVSPEGWPEGRGTRVALHQHAATYDDFKAARFEKVTVTVMQAGYTASGPKPADGTAVVAAGEAVPSWPGGRLFVHDTGHASWPDFRKDIQSAAAAAEKPLGKLPEGAAVAIGPVTFDEIHINPPPDSRTVPHGFHRRGGVTDTATGVAVPLGMMHFMHPLYEHLEDRTTREPGHKGKSLNGQDFLAVHTNRLVALVWLSDFAATEPPMTTEEPSRLGFLEEVLFAQWTTRSVKFNDYNDPPSYHVDPMDVFNGLPDVARRKGLALRGLLVAGPMGPLWTYWVIAFIEEPGGIRVNTVVFPHARLTGKSSGLITKERFREVMRRIAETPPMKAGAMNKDELYDILMAEWQGHEAKLHHGNLFKADPDAQERTLKEINDLLDSLKDTGPVSDK